MSTGAATEPIWTSESRAEYARRMHEARTTISIAIARTTAITLLMGASTLTVTGNTDPDLYTTYSQCARSPPPYHPDASLPTSMLALDAHLT